jgi:HEAT repeat protein
MSTTEKAWETLIKLLDHHDPDVRIKAALAIIEAKLKRP